MASSWFSLNYKDDARSHKHKIHMFAFINFIFRKSCRLWDMWQNVIVRGRPQMTMWRMRIACWIPKATNTHSEYAVLIVFVLQQWLHERASLLRYTNIDCLVWSNIVLICTTVKNGLSFFIFPYSSHNIVRVINSRRMRWAGHVAQWVRRGGSIGSCWGNRREGDHWGDLGEAGWII